MTEQAPRTAAPRDVPPPRPVAPAPAPAEEGGLARAARAVAEAVAGLVGGAEPAPDQATASARPGRTGLRDVLGAVVTAVGAAAGGNRAASGPAPGPADVPGSEPGRSASTVLDDLLSAAAPRLPVRDAERLRAAHPGASDAEIADALVARAARLTAGIGAATGGLAAAHKFAPSSLLTVPLGLGAETVLTAAVEVVLIGELHELHGRRPPGDARARGSAYLSSWSAQRSGQSTAGVGSLLGAAGLEALQRLGRRTTRSASTSAPLLLGAALVGRSNRRATETLAARVLRDLRGGA
jgi:hypothetical protein